MPDSRADQCRQNAEECRRQANSSPKPNDKFTWLKMAADWLKLAETLDASEKKKRKPQSD
jgi:hypothetical protein